MEKKYQAVFFDWDGTAVESRKAPVEDVVDRMKVLLGQGVKLIIVSGTTYENIADGKLHTYFTSEELCNLYLGLGRGAYNYQFEQGKPVIFDNQVPNKTTLLKIHDACYEIHKKLYEKYDYVTDVVFSRPNYCKIDIMVENVRGENLFMQGNEIERLKSMLLSHGIQGGLETLLDLATETGKQYGFSVKPTCDAKYLEVGTTDKSDNVDTIFKKIGIPVDACCFWGDEYVGIEPGIYGSDSYMRTELTKEGDFYDVSEVSGDRPEHVKNVGGGVNQFLNFLEKQGAEK